MRIGLVILFLASIAGAIVFIFWNEEMKYALPTPVPHDYKSVAVGTPIDRPRFELPNTSMYLHFYNPDCPCSRFNAQHIRQLIRSHGDSVAAYVVVPTADDIEAAKKEFGEALAFRVDINGALSGACGVYSTPQAVVIDSDGKLYYRGNYNRARYCTASATNYAELALLSMMNGASPPVFDLLATQSYGCSLPQSANSVFTFTNQ
ncbi:MAG: AhpC/TSA family protein [Cyclobacteriaceae bacterium]|nr:AhpC/TSA family protein [Cyclobacteriaceae bacterium]